MKTIWKILVLVGITIILKSCGQMSGIYKGVQDAHFDALVFKPNHKVELVFLGSRVEADYVKDGTDIKINTNMGTQVLSLDANGCLDGGFVMGKYCKE